MKIKDLECCGNCKSFDETQVPGAFNPNSCITFANNSCDDWTWDKLTATERKE